MNLSDIVVSGFTMNKIKYSLTKIILCYLLPTAYVVREEVIFSVCVSVHTGGGGYPIPGPGGWRGYPIPGPGRGGTPFPGPGGGVAHPRSRQGGTHPGTPQQGDTHLGYPLAGGTHPGYPPPHQEQHSVYLLCGGRYASCIHAGLSCNLVCI